MPISINTAVLFPVESNSGGSQFVDKFSMSNLIIKSLNPSLIVQFHYVHLNCIIKGLYSKLACILNIGPTYLPVVWKQIAICPNSSNTVLFY